MKFQQQLILQHDPERGIYGDCYRTCLAILLGVDAVSVPHFVEYSILDADRDGLITEYDHAMQLARDWLRRQNKTLLHVHFTHDTPVWAMHMWAGELPFILTVNGSFPNTSHAVIGRIVDGELRCIWCPTTGGPRSNIEPWSCLGTGNRFYSVELVVGIPEGMDD